MRTPDHRHRLRRLLGRPAARPERGNVALLVAICAAALFLAAGIAVDGGAKAQAARDAYAAASGAARAGADAAAASTVSEGATGLDTAIAATAARNWLARSGATGTVTVDGLTLTVTCQVNAPTRFLAMIGISQVTGTATATADLEGVR